MGCLGRPRTFCSWSFLFAWGILLLNCQLTYKNMPEKENYPAEFPSREHYPPAADADIGKELPASLNPEQRAKAGELIQTANEWLDIAQKRLETSSVLYGGEKGKQERQERLTGMGNQAPALEIEQDEFIKRREHNNGELMRYLKGVKEMLYQGKLSFPDGTSIEEDMEKKINSLA